MSKLYQNLAENQLWYPGFNSLRVKRRLIDRVFWGVYRPEILVSYGTMNTQGTMDIRLCSAEEFYQWTQRWHCYTK